MQDETSLEGLRQRVGVEGTRERVAAMGEVGASVLPALDAVLASPGETHGTKPMAEICGLSPVEFSLRFKQALGFGLQEFADRVRVDRTLVALASTQANADEVAHSLGFLAVATMGLSIAEYTGLPLPAVLALLRP